ncbi:MAG: RagB/SusD family nutrient uptake outer membrane protein [Rikenellaceae bacterium]|nr:RagB/SusD family nutrient uptake outer membrane protein [Rikenellaceae bacterium]
MRTPMGPNTTKSTGVNNTIMRFADVLLMYAEVANENHGGPTPEAIEAVKRVRRRAFAPEDWAEKVDDYVESRRSKEEFFDMIVQERAWEFGGEGHRRFDLARWNLHSKTMYNLYLDVTGITADAFGHGSNRYSWFPEYIYHRTVPDPEHPSRTVVEVTGINPKEPVTPVGYTASSFGRSFGTADEDGNITLNASLEAAFRGFITKETVHLMDPENLPPLRYLIPYPAQAINDHRGELVNYYGFQ